MQSGLDQQPAPGFNAWRRTDRAKNELTGIARGLIADGSVCSKEFEMLVDWIEANPEAVGGFPGDVLADQLEQICEDKRIDPDELLNLRRVLSEIVGGDKPGLMRATSLPLDRPAPPVHYDSRTFVFTGTFAYGPRRICEEAVRLKGGRCSSNVSMSTHYLVIGTIASRDWINSSHGRKIESAIDFKSRGRPIAIISEDHWVESLDEVRPVHAIPSGSDRLTELLRRVMADDEIDADEIKEVFSFYFSNPDAFEQVAYGPRLRQLLLEIAADGKCTPEEALSFETHVFDILSGRA